MHVCVWSEACVLLGASHFLLGFGPVCQHVLKSLALYLLVLELYL